MLSKLFNRFHRVTPVNSLQQITPFWLTNVMATHIPGYDDRILELRKTVYKETNLSVLVRLEIKYRGNSKNPSTIILKLPKLVQPSHTALKLHRKEVDFYTRVIPYMQFDSAPKCYGATIASEGNTGYLLLEDLTETCIPSSHPVPPPNIYCEQDVVCLAKLHAYWWNHPELGKTFGEIPNAVSIEKHVNTITRNTRSFIRFLGDRLSPDRRELFEQALQVYSNLLHWQQKNPLTLIHGDAHTGNFLNGRDSLVNRTCLLDWEFWRVDICTDDLAFMIARAWYLERRQRLENHLLRLYYNHLISSSIDNFSWEQCLTLYNVSVIKLLFRPVQQWINHMSSRIWWQELDRVFCACEDLKCIKYLPL